MQILTVDIGTGTQDIFLYDSRLDIENGFKMVLPSPTMMVHRRIQQATQRQQPLLLTGTIMGGGPSQWATENHLRAGLPVYATPAAARSFNDDLEVVQRLGITLVSEDESQRLPGDLAHIILRDFDLPAIQGAFAAFGVTLDRLAAVAVAVFDHGNAPPDISDRQFRFDYLDERLRLTHGQYRHPLSAFAFQSNSIHPSMTRLHAVADSYQSFSHLAGGAPLLIMDTAPAAILGATFDPMVRQQPRQLIANIGNFHTLAFRLGPVGVEGLFEHHTGLLDAPKLQDLLLRLADSSLQHTDVFQDHGHGALIYDPTPFPTHNGLYDIAIIGPRRSILADLTPSPKRSKTNAGGGQGEGSSLSPAYSRYLKTNATNAGRAVNLRPYFAVPFGDVMITGCFGLLAATADLFPVLAEPIRASLRGAGGAGTPPWEVD